MHKKMTELFQKSIGKCDICFNTFSKTEHIPVLICSMHHTVCKVCLDSLDQQTHCPFCREQMKMGQAVINYYIHDLLPEEGIAPNNRTEMPLSLIERNQSESFYHQHQQTPRSPSYSHSQYKNDTNKGDIPDNISFPDTNNNSISINNRSPNYVYPQLHNQLELNQDSQFEERMASHRVATIFLTIVQVPLILINLSLAFFYPFSKCMDFKYSMSFLVLRPWLLVIGLLELVLLAGMVLINKLHAKGHLSRNKMVDYGQYLVDFAIAKVLIWGMAELGLFSYGMINNCSGGVVIYGILLIILHITLITLYLWNHKSMMIAYFDI